MKKIFILFTVLSVLSCTNNKSWQLQEVVKLEGINPIGIAAEGDHLWLSDGDHNRLVQINTTGKILSTINSLERPMHIDFSDKSVYVPEYGRDSIAVYTHQKNSFLSVTDSLDAPAGISIFKNEKAIADFYNHRILYTTDDKNWISFGTEGKKEGEFYYPTDVQITSNEIWVADAYNNRVQVFDKKGTFIRVLAQDQNLNAATGIYVSTDQLFVTDFENDRVLILDHQGKLEQELTQDIEKPTDMLVHNNTLYIINYRTGNLNSYALMK